jgi:hypothetical protein
MTTTIIINDIHHNHHPPPPPPPPPRRLFSDHIRKLDKRINQGLTKLTWASKGVVEFYVKDCLNNCSEVHNTVRRKTTKQAQKPEHGTPHRPHRNQGGTEGRRASAYGKGV